MVGKLKVKNFPFRFIAIWLLCLFLYVGAYFRHGTIVPWWVIPMFTIIFIGCFCCEYNRRVIWNAEGIRHYWRGKGYLFFRVIDEYIALADITEITTDRYSETLFGGHVFDNFAIQTADGMIYAQPSYFTRESLEDLLNFVQQSRPDVVFDEDVLEFMNGGFLENFPYKFSTNYRLIKEGKM